LFQSRKMFGGSVTFVLGETVLGELFVDARHNAVARDLGDDAGGGDGEAFAVAFDDGGLRDADGRDVQAVYEDVIGFDGQGVEGQLHRPPGGAEDVVAINDLDLGD